MPRNPLRERTLSTNLPQRPRQQHARTSVRPTALCYPHRPPNAPGRRGRTSTGSSPKRERSRRAHPRHRPRKQHAWSHTRPPDPRRPHRRRCRRLGGSRACTADVRRPNPPSLPRTTPGRQPRSLSQNGFWTRASGQRCIVSGQHGTPPPAERGSRPGRP